MSIRQPAYNFKLTIDGVTYDIDEPKGFADLRSRVVRDKNYHGVFYEMTPEEGIDLGFSGIAKGLLRAAFDADGVDSLANINFQVDKVDTPDAEATRIFGDSATTELEWDANTKGFAQKFTLNQLQVLTKARLYFGANTGSPTSTINAYICSVVGTTLTNLTGPINFAATPSGYTEFEIPYDLEAGDYAIKFVSANDGTLDATNYYTIKVTEIDGGMMLFSTDSGSTWASGAIISIFWQEVGTNALPTALQNSAGGAYDSKIWTTGGMTGSSGSTTIRKVYYSEDLGETWNEAGTNSLPLQLHFHGWIVFGGQMYILGGRNQALTNQQKVYSSTDGISWPEVGTNVLPEAMRGFGICLHDDGKVYIAGGFSTVYKDEVYSSADMETWVEVGALPAARLNGRLISIGGILYFSGGSDSSGNSTRTLFKSEDDGATWAEVGTNVIPIGLASHSFVEHDDKMFIYGGARSDVSPGESDAVFYSEDNGATWPQHENSLPSATNRHIGFSYNNSMWAIGGSNAPGAFLETVYNTFIQDYNLKSGITLEPHVQTLYLGNVDFSHATEDQDFINVKILKSDVLIDVLNNRDIKINIADSTALDGTSIYGKTFENVFMDAFPINKRWKGRKINDFAEYVSSSALFPEYFTFSPDDVILIEEIDEHQNIGISEFVTVLESDNSDAIWIADSDPDTLPIYSENIGITTISIGFSSVIKFTLINANTVTILWELYVDHYNSSNVLIDSVILDSFTQSGITGGNVEVEQTRVHPTDSLSTTITLDSGDYVKVYYKYDVTFYLGLDQIYFHCTQGFFDVSFKIATVQPYSIIPGLKAFDALEGAIEVMTGQTNALVSNLFDAGGCGAYTFITNGWNVRAFEDKPIITSFKHLFDGLQAIFGLGYGIENGKVRVELWEHFYQNAQLIDLGVAGPVDEGKVGDYREEVMGDMIFNKVVLGFENYADDEKLEDTIYDFHTISEWNTPIKNHKGEFRQVSGLILSPYLIESTRRVQFLNKPTESFRWDDHLFMLAIEDYYDTSIADYQIETNETILATGIPYPADTPNLRYTIKRMLLNWGVWINSFAMRYKEITESVKNTFFKNNGSLVTQFSEAEDCLLGDLDRASLTENADITKAEIQNGTALFDQVFIRFKRKLSDEELDTIKSAHDGTGDNYLVPLYGYIKLRNTKGQIVSGWLMDMTYNIYDQVADFVLIKRYVAGETTEPSTPPPEGLVIAIGSYSNVGQRFSVAAGTLVSIKVTVQTAGGTVNVYIAPVLWDGLPDISNKIYEDNVTLAVGENTIPLNLAIATGGVYMIVFEYISTTVYLTTIDQTGYFTGQTDQYLARQINDGDWQAPSEQYPVNYFVNSIPTLASNRYWFSAGVNYTDLFHYIDRDNYQFIANTIQFLSDVEVKTLKFYATIFGSPTAVLQGMIYTLDENDKPDAPVCYTSSITVVNGVNTKNFTLGNPTLVKGRYAVVIAAATTGVLDENNGYYIRATSNQDVFRAGVMYKKGLETSSLWLPFSYDLVFELTYEQV